MHTKANGDTGQRVLVVDDERNIRLTLAQALETLGLDVTPAADGLEALDLLRQTSFGLVLLDLRMPGLDGMTVLCRIREQWPACPVVVFTAHGSVERAAEALKLGAADFVRKPFTPKEIRALVEAVRQHRPRPTIERSAGAEQNPRYRVVVPVTDPEAVHDLLRLAAASAHSYGGGEIVAVHVTEVPRQTPLHTAHREREKAQQQYVLFNTVRESTSDLSVRLRTRAIATHDTAAAFLNVIEEEQADHVLLGRPRPGRAAVLTDVALQTILSKTRCEVTLACTGPHPIQNVVALITEGRQGPPAARRALELAQSAGMATLTLLNVQPRTRAGEHDSEVTGEHLVRTVAEKAGLPSTKYRPRVIVDDDLEEVLLRATRAYDTICMGASRSTPAAQSLFGTLPERLMDEATTTTIAVVRGPQSKIRTVLDAIAERLSGRR